MTLIELFNFLESRGVTGDMEISRIWVEDTDKIEDLEVEINEVNNSFEVN